MALTRLQPAALQPSAFSGLNITDGSLYPVDLSTGAPLWDSAGSITIQTPNTSSSYLKFSSPNTTTAAMIGGYDDGSNSGHLEFYTKNAGTNTEWLRLTSTGKLGLGTQSPVNKLDINSGGAQGFHFDRIGDPYYGALMMFDADAGSANQGWRIGARYYSGIGSAFIVELKTDSTYAYATNPTVSNSTGFTEYFRIASSGKIGINEPAPSLAALEVAPRTQGATAIIAKSLAGDTNGLKLSMDSAGVGYINAGYSVSNLAIQTNGVDRIRIDQVSNGGSTAWVKLGARTPIGHARYNFSPNGATASYAAAFTLPSNYGMWEVSVYAYRNVGGQYGTYYGCWHVAGLDGYPYGNWGSSFVQVSSFTMNQTSAGPTLTSMTAAANGAMTLTLGNYPGGITIVARLMTDGPSY